MWTRSRDDRAIGENRGCEPESRGQASSRAIMFTPSGLPHDEVVHRLHCAGEGVSDAGAWVSSAM